MKSAIDKLDWIQYLNPSAKKMFKANMKYLQSTTEEIQFR